jgi:hypothetical protein
MDIDFALAWHFVDLDGRPRQLRFRTESSDDIGQLIAVVAEPDRRDAGDTLALTRSGVALADVEAALDGWQQWATLVDDNGARCLNLAETRRRLHAANLD